MSKKFTIEFCKQIASERGYEILNKNYYNKNENLKFIHIECENFFEMSWGSFYNRGSGCPQCANLKRGNRTTTILFCKEEAEKRGYLLLSEEYVNQKENLNFKHISCDFLFSASWTNFYHGKTGCPRCSLIEQGLKRRIEFDFCIEKAFERGYKAVGEYYRNNQKFVELIHIENNCNNRFVISWDGFYNVGQGCSICATRKTHEGQKLKINYCKNEALKRGYEILSNKYENNYAKMDFKHLKCNSIFPMCWSDFQQSRGCPECARKGQESSISTNLKKYYLKYFDAIPEYEECINPRTNQYLPYDIFIPKRYKDSQDIFIEVQGHQHYRFTYLWHKTLEDFEYSKYKDRIKKQYAKQNGIFIEIDLRNKESIELIIEKINDVIYYGE